MDVPRAATALVGERAMTDSRDIVTAPDSPVHGGAIFRIVSGRAARDPDPDRIDTRTP